MHQIRRHLGLGRRPRHIGVAFVAVLGLFAAACGDDDDDDSTAADSTTAAVEPTSAGSEASAPESESTGTAASSEEPTAIKIGSLHSLTGPSAVLGEATAGGAKVAAAEIEEAGGFDVNGTKYVFDLVEADSATDPARATAALNEIIRDEEAQFVFGPEETQTVQPVQAATSQAGVPFFTASYGVRDSLTNEGPDTDLNRHTWAVGSGSILAYNIGAQYMFEAHPDIERVAILYPAGASLDPLYEVSVQAIEDQGGEIVADIRFDPATRDYTPLLTRIAGEEPDLLWIGNIPNLVNPIVQQATALGGVSKYVFGTTGSPAVGTGEAIGGTPPPFPFAWVAPGSVNPADPSPEFQAFLEKYEEVNGKPPPTGGVEYTPFYHGPILALATAMSQAGSVDDIDAIQQALTEVEVDTPAGPYSFNADHMARYSNTACETVDTETSCTVIPYEGD